MVRIYRCAAFALAVSVLLVSSAACSGRGRAGDPDEGAAPTTAAAGGEPRAEGTTSVPDCAPARAAPAGTAPRRLMVGGVERSYLLHVPPGYDGSVATPLVLTLHGLGSTAERQLSYTRWPDTADVEGALVAAPQAQGQPTRWDVLAPLTDPASDGRFVLDLVAELQVSLCLDADRVYLDGMSLGSAVTQLLACRGDGTFAAFGGVAVAVRPPDPTCDGSPPAPLRYFHGTADPIVPFAGGRSIQASVRPAEEVMADWAAANGCATGPIDDAVGEAVVRRSWTDCEAGADVVFDIIDGGGHTWPGSTHAAAAVPEAFGATTDEVDATAELWAFYEGHRRAR